MTGFPAFLDCGGSKLSLSLTTKGNGNTITLVEEYPRLWDKYPNGSLGNKVGGFQDHAATHPSDATCSIKCEVHPAHRSGSYSNSCLWNVYHGKSRWSP